MSVRLVLVRHGESEGNLRKDFYDGIDLPLTETGRDQATKVGLELMKYFAQGPEDEFPVKRICVSSYKRARETAELALQEIKASKEIGCAVDPDIVERGFHGLCGKEVSAMAIEDLCGIWDYHGDRSMCFRIESLSSLRKRAERFLKKIKDECDRGTVIAFSHGGFGLMVEAILTKRLGADDGRLYEIRSTENRETPFMRNGEILEFVFSELPDSPAV